MIAAGAAHGAPSVSRQLFNPTKPEEKTSMDYSRYKDMLLEKKDGIATLTLNRPELYNTFTDELHYAMEHVWLDLAEDPEVNVIIITGAGRSFSSGGNVKEMATRRGSE